MVVVTLIIFLLFGSFYVLYDGGRFRKAGEWVKEIKEDYLIRVLTLGVFQRCRSGIGVILGNMPKRWG